MASTHINVNADLMKNVTMQVTVTTANGYRLRKWLAILSIRFAAWLLGCAFEVNLETSDGGR